jgi:hypothetical protein
VKKVKKAKKQKQRIAIFLSLLQAGIRSGGFGSSSREEKITFTIKRTREKNTFVLK